MSATIVKIEHTRLPELTSRARELQWCMEFRQREYANAGSQKEYAWRVYQDAVDNPRISKAEKDEIYLMATLFDDICDEAWRELDKAKRDYLQLFQ